MVEEERDTDENISGEGNIEDESIENERKFLKARLRINREFIDIVDIERKTGFGKGKGLMFSDAEDANAMLFEFNSDTRRSITSLFCPPFLAIWLNENNKILEYKVVSPGKLMIKPRKYFRRLIEIPLNNKYSPVVEFILDKGKV